MLDGCVVLVENGLEKYIDLVVASGLESIDVSLLEGIMIDASYIDHMRTKLKMKGNTVVAHKAAERLEWFSFYSRQPNHHGCPPWYHVRAISADLILFQSQQLQNFSLSLLFWC